MVTTKIYHFRRKKKKFIEKHLTIKTTNNE